MQVSSKTADPPSKDAVKAVNTAADKSQINIKAQERMASLKASLLNNVAPIKKTQPVEKQVWSAFKDFAHKERAGVLQKADEAKKKKLKELQSFAKDFKLGTPVPSDLIGIIAKDPKRQLEIQEKAKKNAEDVKRTKELAAKKSEAVAKDAAPTAAKSSLSSIKASEPAAAPATAGIPSNMPDSRAAVRGGGLPMHGTSTGAGPNRHPGGNRQSYGPGPYQQPYRNDRGPNQNLPRHSQQGGHMAQHLRNNEHRGMVQTPLRNPASDMRNAPTGPASSMGPPQTFAPRHTGMPMGPPRLNPSSSEFKPSAQVHFQTGPSATSSPRSALTNVAPSIAAPAPKQIKFRKQRAIDVGLCNILSGVMASQPEPSNTKAKAVWDENGLRPPYDTPITWKTVQTGQPVEEGRVSWKDQFDRPPVSSVMATPTNAHAVPQQLLAHQYQLPIHMQQGAPNVGPRQSPHIAPIPMHGGHPGHAPHMPFNAGDDGTRMMQPNQSQPYPSPRPGQAPMPYPMMNSPSHMPYAQPAAMQGYAPGPAGAMTPQMRYNTQNQQYMPPQPGPMGPPMMMPGYMGGPQQQMMPGAPQMQMNYPGMPPNFAPVPPQAMQGTNGYPSPGRAAPPMMAHQGSHQGQIYGMSPNGMQFQQPYFQQQPGPSKFNNRRYSSSGGHY